jgi:hypothetical protein
LVADLGNLEITTDMPQVTLASKKAERKILTREAIAFDFTVALANYHIRLHPLQDSVPEEQAEGAEQSGTSKVVDFLSDDEKCDSDSIE